MWRRCRVIRACSWQGEIHASAQKRQSLQRTLNMLAVRFALSLCRLLVLLFNIFSDLSEVLFGGDTRSEVCAMLRCKRKWRSCLRFVSNRTGLI